MAQICLSTEKDHLQLGPALEQQGHQVTHLPFIKTHFLEVPPLPQPEIYQALIFTSRRAVQAYAQTGMSDLEFGNKHPVAAVGVATAKAVTEELGWAPSLIGDSRGAASLAALCLEKWRDWKGLILWPCSARADQQAFAVLTAAGYQVAAWPLYTVESLPPQPEQLKSIDTVFCASPSGVQALFACPELPPDLGLVLSGQSSAQAVPDTFHRVEVAAESTTQGCLAAFQRILAKRL